MANRRASGEGLLRWRKDRKHWEGRITIGTSDDGKPINKCFSGKTQREVIEKMNRFREQLRGTTLSADSRMKLRDWAEQWLNEYMVHVIRPQTISRYRGLLQLHVYPYLGDYQISKITTIQIQRMYNDLKENGRRKNVKKLGKGLSGNTVRGIHMFEMLFLDVTTGLRRGELVALKWSDLNIRRHELKISRQYTRVNGELIISKPKTPSAIRTIKLTKITTNVLKKHQVGAISEWMFPSPLDPTRPIDPEACGRRLKRILEKAGCRNIRFHDIRHTFATMALENGIDVKTVADILGHNTVETALDTYTHITSEMLNHSANTIDRKIAGVRNVEEPTELQINRDFVPASGKKRRSGTGYIKQLSPNCWQGRYSPIVNGKRETYNVHAETEEECEKKLAQIIKENKNIY